MAEINELTIADAAKAAGVSVSTVSHILNGEQDVAAGTRARVQQVIQELGRWTWISSSAGLPLPEIRSFSSAF